MVGSSTDAGPLCPSCGRQLPAGAKFCGYDGTILGATSTRPAQSGPIKTQIDKSNKLCPKCETIFPPHAMFCTKDASKLIPLPGLPAEDNDENFGLRDLTGQVVGGKYKLDHFLGEGGMAVVYKATHLNMERPVVIKIMQPHLLANERSVKRFEQEAKLTAKVSHPNVVSVFDVGFLNGNQPYLVMEYIRGESLRERLDREGAIPATTAAQIIIQVCRGLNDAHAAGIIHRDLKPENILLQERIDRPDWVKIVDFGIAHLVEGKQRYTKTGNVVGTVEYMAPEQLRDVPIDTRCDIYALGVMLFEMLTTLPPFTADTLEAVLVKQLMDKPPMPSQFRPELTEIAPAFDRIFARAMEKNPDDRYQSVTEMRLDVEQAYNEMMMRKK